ncbi:MAG: O-methyltransferase [Elusimicrobia bacterium]|nr:O-methyltransferase [Elusimicrobiota bacterium]
MDQERWTAVDRYIEGLLLPQDEALEAAQRACAEAGLPAISVSATQGKLLMLLARLCGARRILEVGTLGGYSAIWLARGLAAGGRLVTLEADPKHAEVARANLERAGLADRARVVVGKALDTLPALAGGKDAPFDLVFIDADKESYPDYLGWALELSRPGTLIVADNVVRGGKVLDAAGADPRAQGIRRFNSRLASEPRLTATELQTVGVKGYDGLAFALVTG